MLSFLARHRQIDQILGSHLFDPGFYALVTGTRFPTARAAIRHFLDTPIGQQAPPHPLFDPSWYLERYPDIAKAKVQPLIHFLRFGGKEGRLPCADFETGWYLETYPDVATSGLNPLVHYVRYGYREGRNPSRFFDTGYYLANNPDIAAAGINPLSHYVQYGRHEGRKIRPANRASLAADFTLEAMEFTTWRRARLAAMKPEGSAEGMTAPPLRLLIVTDRTVPVAEGGTAAAVSVPAADLPGLAITLAEIDRPAALSGLGPETYDYILVMGPGDDCTAEGLALLAAHLAAARPLMLFDGFSHEAERYRPLLLPGINRLHLETVDACFSRFCLKGDLVAALVAAAAPATARELLLAALAHADLRSPSAIGHIAAPLFGFAIDNRLIASMQGGALPASYFDKPDLQPFGRDLVTIAICTKDKGHILNQLIASLLANYGPVIERIVIVSNNTALPHSHANLQHWASHPQVKIIEYKNKFNFSEQSNLAGMTGKSPYLLFLNDDIIPLSADWLLRLLKHFDNAKTGIAGPLLLYPNESVQHAGMQMGFRGSAGHSLRHARLPAGSYLFHATHAREVSCVTGACLLMRRDVFMALNGFDIQLPSIFQDVDLCLRVSGLGYRIVFEPASVLLHMESATISETIALPGIAEARGREHGYFVSRHSRNALAEDPLFNSAFDREDETLKTLR